MRTASSRLTGHVHPRVIVPVVPVYATPGVLLREATYVPDHQEPRPPFWQGVLVAMGIVTAILLVAYLLISALHEPVPATGRGGLPVNVHTLPAPGPSGGVARGE